MMFGGYTEIAAYYVNTPWRTSGEFDQKEDSGQLPLDYCIQNIYPDPWNKQAACQNDFIMIAEFSEQEGPRPLIIIPKDGGGTFDLNEFSVRIMSADFQTVSGTTFNKSGDTQVIMSETNNGLYAFVHHFTLYDYQARGFVRPFCMTYVTPDQRKLFSEFEDLSSQFKKVAQCFKSGNLDLFVKDLTHFLSDLHYTKERYLEMESSVQNIMENNQNQASLEAGDHEEEQLLKTVTLTALDSSIKEVKALLEVTSSMLTELEVISPITDSADIGHKTETDESVSLDNFHYSCSLHGHGSSKSMHWMDQRERAGSVSQIVSNWTDEKDIYKPKLVRTTKRRFEKSLRTLHELCMWGAKDGLNRLRNLHKYFCRELYMLHMEEIDAESMDPLCGILTIGRTIIMNYFDQFQLNNSLFDADWDSANMYSSLNGKWFSSDTMSSFHSASSFLSCSEDLCSTKVQHSTPVNITRSAALTENILNSEAKDTEPHSSGSTKSVDVGAEESGCSGSISNADDLCQKPVTIADVCLQPVRINIVSSVDHLTNFNHSCPGYGVHKLIMDFPGVLHVIYSLLIGRPTIIFATVRMEKDIQATINTLSMFVPGYSNFSDIVPYHTNALCINDIAHSKLIGLCRPERRKLEHVVHSSVKQYVTIFDIEKRTIWAPEYKGGLLTELYNNRKSFTNDQSYMTYIHSVVYDLAVKSFTYFHKFCLGCEEAKTPHHSNSSNNECWLSPCDRLTYTRKSVSDIEKLHVYCQDGNIIQYFSEVVRSQHMNRKYLTDASSSTTRLQYVKCNWIKT